ncbi:MAG TPA: hypothetical protein VGX52_20440 [Burkholderiales bacterium]|nr:hypothetical protein [Burkholderiales bacterium]
MAKAKQALFVVHGMGDHDEKSWCNGFRKSIAEIYGRYEVAQFMPFAGQIDVKPLYYNDWFDDRRKQWKKAADEVIKVLQPLGRNGPQAIAKAMEWAASADKDEFLLTHVLDVLLYRFVPTIGDAVRSSVRKQLLEGMKGYERWSVIGHSLGSSVLHDALVWMFDPSSPASVKPEQHRFQAVAMVANVSRVLESSHLSSEHGGTRWDAYRSVVQPNVKVTKGVCDRFLNVWHTWDPVPLPKQFKPQPDWPDRATRDAGGKFLDIEIGELEASGDLADVHDLEHYLRNPCFHIPLFRSLIPLEGLISPEEEHAAVKKHRAEHPRSKVLAKIDALKPFRLSDEEENWGAILTQFHEFLAS